MNSCGRMHGSGFACQESLCLSVPPDSEAPEELGANSEHICMLEILPLAFGVEEGRGI